MTDLAALLVLAIANDRDRINAAAEPFVGRIAFRVDLDCNIAVSHITVSFRPMPEQLTSAPTPLVPHNVSSSTRTPEAVSSGSQHLPRRSCS